MGTNVHLTPELERFAQSCVESGRYNSVSEVVRDALRRLQDAEERRRKFNDMLDEVRADAERNGTIDIDTALAEVDRIIDEAEAEQAKR